MEKKNLDTESVSKPFFKSINIPIVYFGLIWAILNLSVGITSYNSYRIEKNMSPIKIMTIISKREVQKN